jgi:Domain of unknown function (DUF4395)
MKTSSRLSKRRIERIREQGYFTKDDKEITDLAFGNRFAYQVCTLIWIFGVILTNIPLLGVVMGVAFLSVLLPYHPFDYIYNYLLSDRMQLPKLPPRAPQLTFACSIATIWTGTTIYLFYNGFDFAGYIVGGLFIVITTILSTTDLCLPSIIYNALFKKKAKQFNS